jgi:hypothetical protein
MTEEQWAKERATVIDEKATEEPRFGDGREEQLTLTVRSKLDTHELPKTDDRRKKGL